jgi:hypothetical protein
MIARWTRLMARAMAIFLLSTTISFAVPFLMPLTFNELKIGEQLLAFYNGGFGSSGTGAGPSFGISFTPDFITAEGGVIFPDFRILQSGMLATSSGVVNISGGYGGIFSFYYMTSQSSGAELFSGLNGSGSLVGVLPLPVTSIWTPAGANASPQFQSIVFTGTGLAIDNITFGATVLPEPSTRMAEFIGLAFFLGWAGFSRSKRNRRALGLWRPSRRELLHRAK